MIYEALRGPGTIAFSDPAGAKACLALATLLRGADSIRPIKVVSNRAYDFYSDWDVPVEVGVERSLPIEGAWLFTGTSMAKTSHRYELALIEHARARGIASWSFVDHWTSIAERFRRADGSHCFPDHVMVIDEHARAMAIAEGIPAQALIVHPNPYLDFITTKWRPAHDPIETRARLGVSTARMLLFAPDPVSLVRDEGGWDFEEGELLVDLIEVMRNLQSTTLVVKSHPLQPPEQWLAGRRRGAECGIPMSFATEAIDPLELMQAADVIVGNHSNFLIEANALGCPIVRYFPSSPQMDAIAHLGIGARVNSVDTLRTAIESVFGSSELKA